jgi:pyruvate,water dikinase
MSRYIAWFKDVDKEDLALVGGKGANLGEIVKVGLPVPPGFIVTATAYTDFLLSNPSLREKIATYLAGLDVNQPDTLLEIAQKIQREILKVPVPEKISKEIKKVYHKLGRLFVAVRSSATAEDLPGASFAGQQQTFLNVRGSDEIIEAVLKCWASLFTPRAIFYREEKGFDHFKVKIAVPVQVMIQSDISGVMFTINPVTGSKKEMVIEAIYGLGELLVGGGLTPDHYLVDKSSLAILKREIEAQKVQLVKIGSKNVKLKVSKAWQSKQKLPDKLIRKLAELGKKVERHYFFPQDIEWAVEKGKIYILQTRPVTGIPLKEEKKGKKGTRKLKLLLVGSVASPGVGIGPVRIVSHAREIHKVRPGDILVTEMTNPNFVPVMRRVAAIVTDKGGRTSHAAIVSRELGLPCVVGTKNATKILKDGRVVTVDGNKGRVYQGGAQITERKRIRYEAKKAPKEKITTATRIYVNLAQPMMAAEVAQRDIDGVGLLRAEFMIAEIGIHPKKMIQDKKQKTFINELAEGIRSFCQAFDPRPVVFRATDFKTNEYRSLVGGKAFEPEEPNPFLGFRGCFRYVSDPTVFKLELEAIKKVRNKFGFRNLWLMIPYVRTIRELVEVKKIIGATGLKRSPSFKLWMMVEVPSNVILLPEFVKVGIDGVSIGTNDLTMLILGVDRDNSEVASQFDETNSAVLWALERIIKICHKEKITSSICGQAPSVHPDLVEKIVEWGITSISVNPDAIESTREIVYEAEKRLIRRA